VVHDSFLHLNSLPNTSFILKLVAESLVITEQWLDDDKEKEKDDDDGRENEETNSIEDHQSLPSEVTAEGDGDDVTATTMINGDDLEEGEIADDDRKQYSRDFLLSLQFLDQCKQRPPNLDQNAEYIRKVLVMLVCLIMSLNCHWLVCRSK